MRKAKIVIAVALLQVLVWDAVSFGEQQVDEKPHIRNTYEVVLPTKLVSFIEHSFSGFVTATRADYDEFINERGAEEPNIKEYMMKEYPAIPFACWGDYDGNGLTDVVLVLLQKGTKKYNDKKAKLVAFHQTVKGYKPHVIDSDMAGWWAVAIATGSPGKIKEYGEDGELSRASKNETIIWQNIGSSASVLFWNNDHYEDVVVSD